MNLLQRFAGAVLGLLLLAAALVFASVILAIVAALALMVWACVWWRTRNLPQRGKGVVIEGEYRVENETVRLDSQEDPPRS